MERLRSRLEVDRYRPAAAVNAEILFDFHLSGVLSPVILGEGRWHAGCPDVRSEDFERRLRSRTLCRQRVDGGRTGTHLSQDSSSPRHSTDYDTPETSLYRAPSHPGRLKAAASS